MTENGLHEKMQSEYRTAYSTESALECKNYILRQIYTKQGAILVLLDLSMVFDSIDYNHLFKLLLNWFGVEGTALDSIKSSLWNHSASIHINIKHLLQH